MSKPCARCGEPADPPGHTEDDCIWALKMKLKLLECRVERWKHLERKLLHESREAQE